MDLAFTETGKGEPIVILHGLFGSSRNWGRIARGLGARFHVFALDLPDHGGSPWIETSGYEIMADALATFLRAHDLAGRATVLGHSMGGKVAMTLALGQQQALARLVVVDIAPVAYGHGQTNADIIDALQALPIATLASRHDADAVLAARIPDPMLRAFLLANLERQGERFVWQLSLEGLRRSLPALHGFPSFAPDVRYQGPTLFIAGERSDYIRDEGRAAIRARFPMARLETVPGVGHWVHVEAPDAIVALITRFMDGG